MLVIVSAMKQLNFRQLMDVYEELNLEQGRLLYPHESPAQWALLAEQDFHQYLNECFFRTPGAVYALWQENEKYVSALRLEPYLDGLLIEALETLPAVRGMGYAGMLLHAVMVHYGELKLYALYSACNTVYDGCDSYQQSASYAG